VLLGVLYQGGKFGLSACNLKGFFNKKITELVIGLSGL
jgi:hypothetical protein